MLLLALLDERRAIGEIFLLQAIVGIRDPRIVERDAALRDEAPAFAL